LPDEPNATRENIYKGLMFNYNPYSLTFLNKTPEAKGFDYVNELMDPHSVVEMVNTSQIKWQLYIFESR
jgi:hypothetical protein